MLLSSRVTAFEPSSMRQVVMTERWGRNRPSGTQHSLCACARQAENDEHGQMASLLRRIDTGSGGGTSVRLSPAHLAAVPSVSDQCFAMRRLKPK